MFCNNCGTQYDATPIPIGKSKFCRGCGNVLYKNENNNLIFTTLTNNEEIKIQQDLESERIRQEQIIKQRQLEIQQKAQEEERLKQEEIKIKQQKEIDAKRQLQEEIEKQKQLELEKLRQEQILKQRQLEIQQQRDAEIERLRKEDIEQQKQVELLRIQSIEFAKKQQIELQKQQEIEKLEKEKNEKEFRERELQRQKEYELIQQQEEKQKEERLQKEKEAELISLREKEAELQKLLAESIKPKSSFFKYLLVAFLATAIGACGYFLIDRFILNKPVNDSTITTTDTTITKPITQFSTEKITNDLVGKEIIGWGKIEAKHITNISPNLIKRNDSTLCLTTLSLEDSGIKSNAEITINYLDSTAVNITTNKISFSNIASPNSWYKFEPIPNCAIYINTNNNPIQLKTCENCEVLKMNTNNETLQKLAAHPLSIYISSDNKYKSEVEFTYVPE